MSLIEVAGDPRTVTDEYILVPKALMLMMLEGAGGSIMASSVELVTRLNEAKTRIVFYRTLDPDQIVYRLIDKPNCRDYRTHAAHTWDEASDGSYKTCAGWQV